MAKKKPPRLPIDTCTERQQERGLYVVEKTDTDRHQRHISVCPLDYYIHRNLIKQYQWDAGNELFKLASLANMTPGVKSCSMVPTVQDGANHTADTVASQIDAQREVTGALDSISGKRQRAAVIFVCIEGRFISQIVKQTTYKKMEFHHFLEGIEYVAKYYRFV